MLFALCLASRATAGILLGAAWSPAGIGSLAWDDAGNFSGTLAGEFDGLLRPPLTAHGGWIGSRDAVLAGVALARFETVDLGERNARSVVGGTRLSLDYRRYLWKREAERVGMYGDVGLYGLLPSALTVDSAFTEAEQAEAEANDEELKARIGGLGGQLGLGAEYVFGDAGGRPAIAFGIRTLARLHRGQVVTEESYTVSTVLLTEAALVVEFTR